MRKESDAMNAKSGKPTAPRFVPHAGSPHVVDEEDGPYGPSGVDVSEGPAHDPVNSPSHYTLGSVECIDAVEAATEGLTGFEGFCTGNAMKYIWRWKHKGGAEDLDKAVWYLNRLADSVS